MSLNIITIALDAYVIARQQFLMLIIHGGSRQVLGHIPIRSRLHAARLLSVKFFPRRTERVRVGVDGYGRLRVGNLVVLGLLMVLILRFICCITACDLLVG